MLGVLLTSFAALLDVNRDWQGGDPYYDPAPYLNGEITARINKERLPNGVKYLTKFGVFHRDYQATENNNLLISYGYEWRITVVSGSVTIRSRHEGQGDSFDVWEKHGAGETFNPVHIGSETFLDEKVLVLSPGSSVKFPAGHWHRIERTNPSETSIVLYEAWRKSPDATRIMVEPGNVPDLFSDQNVDRQSLWPLIEDALAEIL